VRATIGPLATLSYATAKQSRSAWSGHKIRFSTACVLARKPLGFLRRSNITEASAMSRWSITFILLFILSGATTCSSLADDIGDLSKATEFWKSLDSLFLKVHSVSVKRIEKGELYESGEYLRQNNFGLVYTHQNKEDTAKLSNPKYRATIARRPDESWRIRWLGTHEAVMNDAEAVTFDNMFIRQICDVGSVAKILSDRSLVNDLRVLPEGKGLSFRVVSKLPVGCKVLEAYQGAEVRIYGPLNSFPATCEVLFPSLKVGLGTRLEYKSFVDVKGVSIPTIVRATFIDAFGGEGKDPSEYRFDYTKIDEPLDMERCYLSFYGLPEPGVRNDRSLWFYALSIFILVAVIAIMRARRVQNR
jgi:hypothetical protein